jgi:hypothetical protein
MTANREWRSQARCASLNPAEADRLFFIGPGKRSTKAKEFCAPCPVKQDCSNFAVLYNEEGIWAGSTDEERRHLDPIIREYLESEAIAAKALESRNLNDFIPQVKHLHQEAMEAASHLADRLAAAAREARKEVLVAQALAEHSEALLEALVHPFDEPIVPQESDQ